MNQDHPDVEKLPLEIDGIPVRETIREIFRDPANGTPDGITKAGCLALALKSNAVGGEGKGYMIWNAWRNAFTVLGLRDTKNLKNHSQFAEIDFQQPENKVRSFACFQFGRDADFHGAHLGHSCNFQDAEWGHRATFDDAHWGNFANFDQARWGQGASFKNCQWGVGASFRCAHWGEWSDFRGARWGADARFFGAHWDPQADFQGAQWGEGPKFKGAQWGAKADFRGACWESSANFTGAQWGQDINFCDTHWGAQVDFSAASWEELLSVYPNKRCYAVARAWAKKYGLSPETIGRITFHGARFLGDVSFENRKFRGWTDFSSSEKRQRVVRDVNGVAVFDVRGSLSWEDHPDQGPLFSVAPKFHGCELHQDTSFEGAQFPPDIGMTEGTEEAVHAYRTLKLAFSKHQADNEEQRFFRLELAEKAVAHRIKAADLLRRPKFLLRNVWVAVLEVGMWLVYKIYDCTSAYGSSVLRPLVFWLVLAVISSGLYIEPPTQETCFFWAQNCAWDSGAFSRSLSHSVPFGGLTDLKNHALSWYHSLGIVAHKAFALVFLFLIGLALRNLFKLK